MNTDVHIHFEHGLGDTANFCRMVPLYVRRGFKVRVSTSPDKAWLFRAVGAEVTDHSGQIHGWNYPDVPTSWEPGHDWAGNKNGCNLSRQPLPDIGPRDELWTEYCAPFSIDVLPGEAAVERAQRAVGNLPRPLILLHTIGNTSQPHKSLPNDLALRLCAELLERTSGTVLVLDWDDRAPMFPHHRLRNLRGTFGDALPNIEELTALLSSSDLLIGVDSGPLHLAGLTKVPRVGIWREGFYPSTYLLPGPGPGSKTLSIVGADKRDWNRFKRIPFAIVETDWSAPDLARLALSPLDPDPLPPQIRQFLSWTNGGLGGHFSAPIDRHKSLRLILERAPPGLWVETGTIRQAEDWAGAGYSTYLFAAAAHLAKKPGPRGPGSRLLSIDLSPSNCDYARRETAIFGDVVEVIAGRGAEEIAKLPGPLDLAYLDSCDTDLPEHADVCLEEARAAAPRISPEGLIAIDDSPFDGASGLWLGKGAKAIPWLLERGWRVLYSGHQCVLGR